MQKGVERKNCMNLYNNKVTRRWNRWVRFHFVAPRLKKRLQKKEISILCNNCTGGFILHDLGLRFDSPTINMFFHSLDFFDFAEHFEHYIKQPLVQIENPRYDNAAPDYPVAILSGGGLQRY